jgi:hypothetical protein
VRQNECARCGYDVVLSPSSTDQRGRLIHKRCPNPPTPNWEGPKPLVPYRIILRTRPLCLQERHNECSGVTVDGLRLARVCECGCHLSSLEEYQKEVTI